MIHVDLNTAANNKHIPEIERYIGVVKEHTCAVYNTLPFTRLPACLLIELIYYAALLLNMFPPNNGVSTTISPRSLVTGFKLDYHQHCQLEFGTYFQTHEEHNNSMVSRTTRALALRPTSNAQGGYYFYSLSSGQHLVRNHWTSLPMPSEVITHVHNQAHPQKANHGLIFQDSKGEVIHDDDPADLDENDDD